MPKEKKNEGQDLSKHVLFKGKKGEEEYHGHHQLSLTGLILGLHGIILILLIYVIFLLTNLITQLSNVLG